LAAGRNVAEVRHNEAAGRFESDTGAGTAVLEYRRKPHSITFVHTEVPPEVEGKGIGGELVHAALEYARAQQLQVIPLCPFVAAYIRRHKEYLEDVAPERRGDLSAH
jgi:uncharacterized protein